MTLGFKPHSIMGDATVVAIIALRIFPQLPGMQGFVYDMALCPADYDRRLSAGLLLISKVQRTKTNNSSLFNLNEHDSTLTDGTKKSIVVQPAVRTARRLRIDAPPSLDDASERSCSKRWASSTAVRPSRLPGPPRHHRAPRMASPNRRRHFPLVRSMETTEPRGLRRRLNQKPPETSGRVASARPNSTRNFRLI